MRTRNLRINGSTRPLRPYVSRRAMRCRSFRLSAAASLIGGPTQELSSTNFHQFFRPKNYDKAWSIWVYRIGKCGSSFENGHLPTLLAATELGSPFESSEARSRTCGPRDQAALLKK